MKISREAAAAGFLTLVLAGACGEDGPSSEVEDSGAAGDGETGAGSNSIDPTDSSDGDGGPGSEGGDSDGGTPVGGGGIGNAGDSGSPGGAAGDGSDTNNGGAGGMPSEVCVNGDPCLPADPCHQGTLDCSTPEPTCVDTALPAADSVLYVNADPAVGLDDHCCGRTTTAGFGGPCRTVSAAMKADGVADKTISIIPTATGDVSAAEVYPWRPGPNVHISSYSGEPVCVPGTPGQPVVIMETGSVTLADLVLGASCEGLASGASVGVQVGPGSAGNEPRVILSRSNIDGPDIGALILPNAVLENVYSSSLGATPVKVSNTNETGIQIDGGTLYGYFEVEGPVPIGVLCRSDSDPAQPSNLGALTGDPTGISVSGASEYDVLASMNCRTPRPISMALGFGACDSASRDRYGLYAEGDAQVVLSEATFRCFQQDGVTLRHNPELSVNAPQVELSNGYLAGAACAAAYVEVGFLRIYDTRFAANHWGAVQRSRQSSPASSLLNLSGQFDAMDLPNEFYCNGQLAAPSCDGPGGDVWNNSGLALDASFNDWPAFPLSQCNCNEALSSCSCVGAAVDETTPPAGISVLGSPFQSSIVGNINVSDAAARVPTECPLY